MRVGELLLGYKTGFFSKLFFEVSLNKVYLFFLGGGYRSYIGQGYAGRFEVSQHWGYFFEGPS